MTLEPAHEDQIVLPIDGEAYREFDRAARSCRIILLAGLPAVGKSLYVQQLGVLAHRAGRKLHLLQWDVTRHAFETRPYTDRYPSVDGLTHAVVRRAVGLWVRGAVLRWHVSNKSGDHLLIGELPIVGGRLEELIQVHDDDCEPLLAGDKTEVFVPVPSKDLRRHIEASRKATITNPGHVRESSDAPPDVVRSNWEQLHQLGSRLGLTEAQSNPPYDPVLYGAVFARLLENRNHHILEIDEVLPSTGSVHELEVEVSELRATSAEVEATYRDLEQYRERTGEPRWSDG